MSRLAISTVIAAGLLAASPASAQAPGIHPPAGAAGVLNALPPDLYQKLERLAQLLDQNIKAGKLNDGQVQQELFSGHLEQRIRSLGPEADHLFDEISADMKNGSGLNEAALLPLLGGLSNPGQRHEADR
ncbi:MAG: hypothetical protein P0111_05615 [Nitrospira sp.]|nr:hypothetical protein [Nitrospira sp.]